MSPLTDAMSYEPDGDAIDAVLWFGDFKVPIDIKVGDTPREVVSKLRRAALVIEEEAREGCAW